ncbi:MAG: TonB-dependent receptor plug domain-containing protein, partial [Bacteroidales bacterium]|nr:TonB-dependent receptor plug domain-containing protein [Bacteroidales bacterium]
MKKRVLFFFFGLCLSIATFAQVQVRGNVSDSQGEPIPGVTVLVKGTQQGVITDIDGNYNISVPGSASVLVFSFVGMDTQEVVVGNRTTIGVVLTETLFGLDEIIVVGYGTMRKSDVSGAVASVSSKALQNLTTPDAAAALQGKASGVQVLTNSGAPGQGATIRVRGYSSNSDKIGPLLIVDGLQVDNIQYLDPSMIESVEILKDAASAAIYGAAAGNGVVLVTTKSGASARGTSSITYDMSYANQSLARHPQIFGAEDFIDYKR